MKILTRILAIILVVCLFTFATALAEDGNGEPGNGSIENGNGTPGNGNGTPGNGNGEPGNGNGNGGPGNGNGENNGNGEPPPPPPPPPPPNQNEQLQRELAYWIARAQQLERQLEQEQNDPTQPVPRRPLIHVTDPLWIEMEAGSRRTISFTLRNMGADHATAIVTTADMSEARGITGVFMDAHHSVASLNARTERTFAFQITVNESVTDGFYSIAFNHEYLNARNERITSTSHVTIRVTNQAGNVSLTDISSSPSHVPAGDNFNLSGTIRNDSRAGIRDVSVSITSGMASDGIFLRDSTNVVSIPNLAAGSTHNFSIGFTSSPNAASGAYPLGLEFSYTDSAGQRQTRAQTFFISVTADEDEEEDDTSADVIITNISRPTGAMRVAQEFEMTVTLRNTGENTARNLRVDAVTEADRSIVPRSTSRMSVNRLEPGAEHQLTFRFAATEISTTRSYDIGFTVTYETGATDTGGAAETVTFTQFQGVNIFNPEPDDSNDTDDGPTRISTPRIIVSDYVSNPMIVQAGQEFDLELTFLNTSERIVRNIRVTLTVEDEVTAGNERRGSVFTPVGRSSTFFIDRIDPRSEVVEHIRFFTLPDAPPRNYIINVNFEYEDIDNNPFEARESIGINVKQVTRLDTSEIFIPDSMPLFSPMFFNFELYNTGRVTLSNLMVRIEGNFIVGQPSTFFGSMTPGAMDFFDNTVTPTEAGLQELLILITYEDDTGELIEERREFMVDVFEMDFGGDFEMRPGFGFDDDMVWDENLGMFVPRQQGLGVWAIVGIVAGVLLAAAVIAIVVIRKTKKRRESMVDFDE